MLTAIINTLNPKAGYHWMAKQRIEVYLCLVTCAFLVHLTHIIWAEAPQRFWPMTNQNQLKVFGMYALFITGYGLSFGTFKREPSRQLRMLGLLLSTLATVLLSVTFQYGNHGILAIIIAAQLPEFFKPKLSIVLALMFPLVCGFIDRYINGLMWAYENAMLYALFNLFALMTSSRLISERRLKEQSVTLLRELKATQLLLSSTAKRDERQRIGRDLHDTLGHQLTALSLQLELACHLPKEELQPHIERARTLSGQLLGDVRHAVSEIRGYKTLDLPCALRALSENIPGLNVLLILDYDDNQIDARQAEVIFRCVQEALTNTMKHADADTCIIELNESAGELSLSIKDNGRNIDSNSTIEPGNGMQGLSERVTKIDGQFNFQATPEGFIVQVNLPYQ